MTRFAPARGILLAALLAAAPAAAEPERFATPEAAAEALTERLRARDVDGVFAVFGPENEDLVRSGDDAQDREDWGAFLQAYDRMHRVAVRDDGAARLFVGVDQWPFPVLLREGEGGWAFDAEGARDEILERRIGRNELDVIEAARRYVQAQSRYRRRDWDGDGVMEFAAAILSSPGKRDGLYWPTEPGGPVSPVGDLVARAAAEGHVVDGEASDPEPYLGYYYRILTAQGPAAPGGEMDYRINGRMVGGHALLATPSAWGDTGVMSFLVGENGVVYEADLGEDTLSVAAEITAYDPDDRWSRVPRD